MRVRKYGTSHRRDTENTERAQRRRFSLRPRRVRSTSSAICVLCVSAVSLLLFPYQPTEAFNQKAGGQAAPEFSLKDLKGKRTRLGDYKGKVVLVNIWATWCAPCKAEMPELVRWQNEYKDRGLQIIGVTFQPYRAVDVREAIRRFKINYPILLDTGEATDLYGLIDVLPLTIVIDRDGNIRARIKGIIDAEEFEQKIKPLLETTGKTAG